ncbi:MAG: hypothetical protein WAM14_17420 [Candidatus Nitrosopolaris sp.]
MKSLGIVTLHDACHSFSSRAFKITEELELEIHTIQYTNTEKHNILVVNHVCRAVDWG